MLSQPQITQGNLASTVNSFSSTSISTTRKWPYTIPETIIGDYLIVPITTAKMLKSESHYLNNNSDQYLSGCSRHENCAFSMRDHFGFSQATLVLSHNNEGWRFEKCHGPSNTNVLEEIIEFFDENEIAQTEYYPTELYYVAHEIIRLMNAQRRVQQAIFTSDFPTTNVHNLSRKH